MVAGLFVETFLSVPVVHQSFLTGTGFVDLEISSVELTGAGVTSRVVVCTGLTSRLTSVNGVFSIVGGASLLGRGKIGVTNNFDFQVGVCVSEFESSSDLFISVGVLDSEGFNDSSVDFDFQTVVSVDGILENSFIVEFNSVVRVQIVQISGQSELLFDVVELFIVASVTFFPSLTFFEGTPSSPVATLFLILTITIVGDFGDLRFE